MEREKAGETNNPTGAGSPEAGAAEGSTAIGAGSPEAAEEDGAEEEGPTAGKAEEDGSKVRGPTAGKAEGGGAAAAEEEATGTESGAAEEPKKRVRVLLSSSAKSGEVADGVVGSGDVTEEGEKATEGTGKPRAVRRIRRARPEKVTRSGKEG
jgi:hypothetical protein